MKISEYISKINKAYYFLGFREKESSLYETLQEAGFILVFNLKGEELRSCKKGNVDMNIVFNIMKKIVEGQMDGVLLVSGDGDYKMMVDYLVEKSKFIKVLSPNLKFAFSLYKNQNNLTLGYFDYLNKFEIKNKILYKKKAP